MHCWYCEHFVRRPCTLKNNMNVLILFANVVHSLELDFSMARGKRMFLITVKRTFFHNFKKICVFTKQNCQRRALYDSSTSTYCSAFRDASFLSPTIIIPTVPTLGCISSPPVLVAIPPVIPCSTSSS